MNFGLAFCKQRVYNCSIKDRKKIGGGEMGLFEERDNEESLEVLAERIARDLARINAQGVPELASLAEDVSGMIKGCDEKTSQCGKP